MDEIVIFHRLGREQLREIAEIQLNNVRGLLAKRNITLALTETATDLLIEEGYDPVYGARPLKRVLQRRIIDAAAASGSIRKGMANAFFAVSRVLIKPGLASCTRIPVPRRSA